MTAIRLEGIDKYWGETCAISGIDLVAEEGKFLVLLGPSGCGKSTTLRIIAGLETATSGRVLIGGEDVSDRPPSKRAISMVFQSYALFPHLSAAENIVFGLKVRKVPSAERRQRLREVAELVGLEQLLDRKTAQLSGGQRQRVALARAIIARNRICLMDEPLSNLDAKLRHQMRLELRTLQQRLGMTVVYVTHDQTEAMSMADHVVLMREGMIEQQGTPDTLYNYPRSTFSARFIGTPPMNLLELAGRDGKAVIAGSDSAVNCGSGEGYLLGIRPESITLEDSGGIPAQLVSADYLGADTVITARVGRQEIMVRHPGRVRIEAGETASLSWPMEAARLFDKATGAAANDQDRIAPDSP